MSKPPASGPDPQAHHSDKLPDRPGTLPAPRSRDGHRCPDGKVCCTRQSRRPRHCRCPQSCPGIPERFLPRGHRDSLGPGRPYRDSCCPESQPDSRSPPAAAPDSVPEHGPGPGPTGLPPPGEAGRCRSPREDRAEALRPAAVERSVLISWSRLLIYDLQIKRRRGS